MSQDPLGMSVGPPSGAFQAAQALNANAPATNQALVGLGLAQVPVPTPTEPLIPPKRSADPLNPARMQNQGTSPLATASVAATAGGVTILGDIYDPEAGGTAGGQAEASGDLLPGRHGLVAYGLDSRNSTVYLTEDQWDHIKEGHVEGPPTTRGKKKSTYWPVVMSATGRATMSEQDVIAATFDAVRGNPGESVVQRAMQGLQLYRYRHPQAEESSTGVGFTQVAVTPYGEIRSSYPTGGWNVLAVQEASAEEAAAQAAAHAAINAASGSGEDKLFRTSVPETSFG